MEVAGAYMAEAEAAMVGEMVVGRGDGGDGGGGEGGSGEGLCLCLCDRLEDVEAGSSSAVPSAATKAFVRVRVRVWVFLFSHSLSHLPISPIVAAAPSSAIVINFVALSSPRRARLALPPPNSLHSRTHAR